MTFTVNVTEEKCLGCNGYIRVCTTGTLRIDKETRNAYNTGEVCDNIWDCIKICPVDAIEIVEDLNNECIRQL